MGEFILRMIGLQISYSICTKISAKMVY